MSQYLKKLPPPAGGGVTLRGSDGQLHPRAPPKPLRISAVFPNAIVPPPTRRNQDPSSFYDELVVQVTRSLSIFRYRSLCLSKQRGLPVNTLKQFRSLPVACRFHRPGSRVTWTDYVRRRSGRAGPASLRPPSAFWNRLHSRLYYHRRRQRTEWKTGISRSRMFVHTLNSAWKMSLPDTDE